ncbi:6-carboxytetrahydropterin synthase [uncultured Methanosphaera sp.]|uniref:6-carboxytetrahydropterin synthase n=1 Tax=uncultured Methanosphaera sp. TaxID=262501 RepID=UPI000DC53132|nr:6-carboxytetrahydropterin synthase [uncultured Methanosphaera sp.]MDD6286013.1 6-carboxytetrahydropterin synthase [Methanobacteriaceae archaeon]MDY2744229.1 6-carboxytetrahydropterin synthase [Methanosphaera sp.]RAP43897.1 MAG: 6-carboxytetrahydropterin synthase QueD [Methanosphaera sp. SHI1033]
MKVNLDGIHSNLRFSAAHMVIGHESCGKIHGHSYIVDVEVEGKRSGKFGFVIDFKVLKNITRKICKSLDHRLLIPVDSPDLEITYQDDKTVEFTTLGELEYKIPKSDVVLLPIISTTAESLSIYITDAIVNELEDTSTLEYIEVQVNEGIGQGASYHKQLNE